MWSLLPVLRKKERVTSLRANPKSILIIIIILLLSSRIRLGHSCYISLEQLSFLTSCLRKEETQLLEEALEEVNQSSCVGPELLRPKPPRSLRSVRVILTYGLTDTSLT